MQYVYGALLLHSSGKAIDEQGLTTVLTAAGAQPDAAQVKVLLASLEGVNIADVLAKAETVTVAAAPAAAAASDKKEGGGAAKKEEKEEKGVTEEEAAEGLSALFG